MRFLVFVTFSSLLAVAPFKWDYMVKISEKLCKALQQKTAWYQPVNKVKTIGNVPRFFMLRYKEKNKYFIISFLITSIFSKVLSDVRYICFVSMQNDIDFVFVADKLR